MSDKEREKQADIAADIGEEDVDDPFNLLCSVCVVESEATEIDEEFIEAVTEIEGKKSFPCDKCGKVCKSKAGLTRHTNSKHTDITQETSLEPLDEDIVYSFVEAIKARIIDEDLYGSDTNKALSTVTSTKALFDAVLPMCQTFAKKKNHEIVLWFNTANVRASEL